ncbi:MAG TPA: hypothetical protein VND94_08630 [Terriglobia bacterium]|nr:hypothetical protein [Terriglobia bacterium]
MSEDQNLVVSVPQLKAGGGKAAIRILLEMAAQLTPLTAAMSVLYGYTHPSQFQQDLEKFHFDVAAKLSEQEAKLKALSEFLTKKSTVGDVAVELAIWMLRENSSGRADPIGFDRVVASFVEIPRGDLEEAAAELKAHSYASISPPMFRIRPTSELFLAFDKAATGHDTEGDAIRIASLWLDNEELRSVFRLSDLLGWPPRRLNPALSALRDVFPDGRWSKEIHPTLETTSVVITADERYRLRKIVKNQRLS